MASSSFLVLESDFCLSLEPHPDHYLVDENSGYTIETVRNLIAWSQNKPFNQNFKVILIKHADKLPLEAQNACLKLLEEPAENTYIVLTSHTHERLLATIRSRTTEISLDSKSFDEIKRIYPIPFNDMILLSQDLKTLPDFAKLNSVSEALVLAEKLKKLDREDLINMIGNWIDAISKTNTYEANTIEAMLIAQERLHANTTTQATLEVMFFSILKDKIEQ